MARLKEKINFSFFHLIFFNNLNFFLSKKKSTINMDIGDIYEYKEMFINLQPK